MSLRLLKCRLLREDLGKYVRSRTAGVMKTLMRTVETVERKTRFWVVRRKSA